MRRRELILLHSESVDGCKPQRVWCPLRQLRFENHVKAVTREVHEVLAICEGDAVAALRITLIANVFLKAEIDRLSAAVSSGLRKVRKATRR